MPNFVASVFIHEHFYVESIHSSVFTYERLTEDSKLCSGHYLRLFVSVTRLLFMYLCSTEKKILIIVILVMA